MNELNSVIVEGVVSTRLYASEEEGTFTITSHRYSKVGDERREEVTFVHVIVRGNLLKYAIEVKGFEGRGICVVGRLCNYNGGLSLFAEHIEFKRGTVTKVGNYNFQRD